MSDLEPFIRFWRALDGAFERVEPTWWGAVVTDRRYPLIWDVNYARVESDDPALTLAEVERYVLLPFGKRWFGVREGDTLVALGSLISHDGVGYIDHVVTFPQARRRGYASAIVARIVREARGSGAQRVCLLAESGSGPIG